MHKTIESQVELRAGSEYLEEPSDLSLALDGHEDLEMCWESQVFNFIFASAELPSIYPDDATTCSEKELNPKHHWQTYTE